jgi:H+-transporting ATPase
MDPPINSGEAELSASKRGRANRARSVEPLLPEPLKDEPVEGGLGVQKDVGAFSSRRKGFAVEGGLGVQKDVAAFSSRRSRGSGPNSSRRASVSLLKEADVFAEEVLGEEIIEGLTEDAEEEEIGPISLGLTSEEAKALLEKHGPNKLPEKVIPKWYIFASMLWQPMPLMIWIAAIITIILGGYVDFAVLTAINLGNATLSFYETTKAGDAIAALKASLRPTATVKRDGKWISQFDATQLVPGDLIELHSGGGVPADCMINDSTVDIDESALTGESLPVSMTRGHIAKMGSTVSQGEAEATVRFTGTETFFGKTAALLGDSGEYSNMQKLLLKIMIILAGLSIVLCLTAFLVLILQRNIPVREAATFAVVLLVASIPMAIEIVTTTTLAIGSKELSKLGAIVSRLAAIEDLAGMNMLCSDKTGTLTLNKMVIQETLSYNDKYTNADILRHAAMSTNWKSTPKDALDTLVLRCHLWIPGILSETEQQPEATRTEWYNQRIFDQIQSELTTKYEVLEIVPFNPTKKRTECTLKDTATGEIFRVTKGAPHVISALDKNAEVAEKVHHMVQELGKEGIRAMVMAISDPITKSWTTGPGSEEANKALEVEWHITGLMSFLDPPRPDTKDTIIKSQAYGCPVVMITGDHALIAIKTCKVLEMGKTDGPSWPNIHGPEKLPMLDSEGNIPEGLAEKYGEYIKSADGFAQVYPEHKFLIVEAFRQMQYKVGMTGDGVNDAPALKRADVGIAVSGATDAARAAADIVLTKEGLSTIVDGIEIARCIFSRMKSFITYRIAATLQLLLFFFIAVLSWVPSDFSKNAPYPWEWPEFFSLPVLFLITITVINDVTLISVGYDYAVPSRFPERWVLPALFCVAGVIMFVACGSSLLLLYWCLDSNNPGSFFRQIGVVGEKGMVYGHIINIIFLKVAISDILSLFLCRTAQKFFFQKMPHPVLFSCVIVGCTLSTIISIWVPCSHGEATYNNATGKWNVTVAPSNLENVPICGLAYDNGSILAFYTWLYCLLFFVIQDILKVLVFRALIYFNAWNINNKVGFQPGYLEVQYDKASTICMARCKRGCRPKKKAMQAGAVDKDSKGDLQMHA